MMEQTNASKCHCYAVFVACVNNIVVTYGTTCLCDKFHTALVCSLYIVAEWEESVTTQCYFRVFCYPCFLLFHCENFRLLCKEVLPYTVCQYVIVVFTDIYIDCIISVCTTYLFYPWQVHHFRMLA